MTDREELIDAFVQANEEGNLGMWKSCKIAWELFDKFGAYSQDTVSVLSVACNLGYDAIYNRRNAWIEYRKLHPDLADLEPILLPPLSPSHYYRLNRLRNNGIEITNEQAKGYLKSAVEFGWSSGQLCEVVDGNHDPDREKTFHRRVSRISRSMETLISESERMGMLGLPDEIIKQVYLLRKSIEEWINEQEVSR